MIGDGDALGSGLDSAALSWVRQKPAHRRQPSPGGAAGEESTEVLGTAQGRYRSGAAKLLKSMEVLQTRAELPSKDAARSTFTGKKNG